MTLSLGMTVQSRIGRRGREWFAMCCRCQWESAATKYQKAHEIACSPGSHVCERKAKR